MDRMYFVANETPVSKWLTQKFLAWQSSEGSKKTVTEFGIYCGGIPQSYMSRYLNGTVKPENDNLLKIGDALGYEIFDLLDKPRPDPLLQMVIRSWGGMSDATRRRIARIIEAGARRGQNDVDFEGVGEANSKGA